jgi:uncharacterized protein (TIGR02569 family)
MSEPPPPHVLAAFGVAAEPEPLAGGRGRSWRAGPLVLKPLDWLPAELAYQAELLATIRTDGFRVAPPVPHVIEGWTAAPYLEGRHEPGRWNEIIAAGRRLHAALAAVPRPDALLDARDDPWATGDRVAWGEQPYPGVGDLLQALEPVDEPPQLVHGDLTGNVLFHPTLPPAIIDFAPYWRPTEYASAIIVCDALCWENAPAELADAVAPQLLLRAAIFRGVTSLEFGNDAPPELTLARRIAACASRS